MRAALAAALLLFAGCGHKAQEQSKAPLSYFKVDAATAGSVQGMIRFHGKRPAPKRISMEAEEGCQSLHPNPVIEELVSTGRGGTLANVFVYVKKGLEGKNFEPPKETVVLDQHGCQFVPRVVALRSGQTLDVRNSDPVSHNIHPMPKKNRDWNQQQPPGSPDLKRRFARPEVMIPVKCNIHSWMKTYIAVLDHPYFAVTSANGEFQFTRLPPGKYTIAAWHETLGELEETVDVRPGAPAAVEFTFQ
jgi:plastocyanin